MNNNKKETKLHYDDVIKFKATSDSKMWEEAQAEDTESSMMRLHTLGYAERRSSFHGCVSVLRE